MRVFAWVAIALCACGPTAAEVKTAREATYRATPKDVFALAERETAEQYKIGERMPDELVFATVPEWYTDHGRPSNAPDVEQKQAGHMQVSFAVLVIGDSGGAKVTVNATAIDYTPDKPDPVQLDGAALPKWVTERADKLHVTIHRRVQQSLGANN